MWHDLLGQKLLVQDSSAGPMDKGLSVMEHYTDEHSSGENAHQ